MHYIFNPSSTEEKYWILMKKMRTTDQWNVAVVTNCSWSISREFCCTWRTLGEMFTLFSLKTFFNIIVKKRSHVLNNKIKGNGFLRSFLYKRPESWAYALFVELFFDITWVSSLVTHMYSFCNHRCTVVIQWKMEGGSLTYMKVFAEASSFISRVNMCWREFACFVCLQGRGGG